MRTLSEIKSMRGFTILETSIALAILGIIIAALLMPYNLWNKNKKMTLTNNNISVVTVALDTYLVQVGAYPCPARLDAVRSDADYGMATICDNTTPDPNYPSLFAPGSPTTAGTFQSGFYYEDSQRSDADIDPGPGPLEVTLVRPKIRRGMVPFRTLGLSEDQILDGYGMRLQYAVSENLAVPETYVQASGGISIVNGVGASITENLATTHYVIFSTGEDLKGAYTQYGKMVEPCAVGTIDAENCNTAVGNPQDKAVYSYVKHSIANGANHYDDTIKFYSSMQTPLWRTADTSGRHITELVGAGIAGAGVGIGGSSLGDSLFVAGEVRIDNTAGTSNLEVNQICNSDGTGCLNVSDFGVNSTTPAADFSCPVGQYARGFANGKILCGSLLTTEIRCPTGTRIKSILPDGTLNCEGAFSGCVTRNITLCSGDPEATTFSLPSVIAGDRPDLSSISHTVVGNSPATTFGSSDGWTPVVGVSRKERWHCGSSGSWHRDNRWGSCNCSAGSSTYDRSCNSELVGYWDGDITYQTTTVCPSNSTTTNEISRDCECTGPIVESGSQACPDPVAYSGGPEDMQRTWTCQSDLTLPGSFSSWTVTTANCVCNPGTTQTNWFNNCPAGFAGQVEKTRTYDCSTNTWGSWVPTGTTTCDCSGIAPETRDVSTCVSPLTGYVREKRIFDCGGTNTWGPWVEQYNTCGLASNKWRSSGGSMGVFPNSLPNKIGWNCPTTGANSTCSAPNGSGKFFHYPCQCGT